MKLLLPFLLLICTIGFVSCKKKAEPEIGTLSIEAVYNSYSYPVGYSDKSDKGAIVYVFKGVNIHSSDLKFDGVGKLQNSTTSKTYDLKIECNDVGTAEIELEYGTYAVAVVSNNLPGKWLITSFNIKSGYTHEKFKFESL